MEFIKALNWTAHLVYWGFFIFMFITIFYIANGFYKYYFDEHIYPIEILGIEPESKVIEHTENLNFTIAFMKNEDPNCVIVGHNRKFVSEFGDITFASRPDTPRNLGEVEQCLWDGQSAYCNSLSYPLPESLQPASYIVINEIVLSCNRLFPELTEILSAPAVEVKVCWIGDTECLDY